MEALAGADLFHPAGLDEIEHSFALALRHAQGRGRVFVDLWNLERFALCVDCLAARRRRLQSMNLGQQLMAPIVCCSPGHVPFS